MRIDTLSTFPQMFDSVMGESIMKRAREKGALDFNAYDLRDWTHDRHRTTDDEPYGGGHGLVMKCEPVYEALESILSLESGTLPERKANARVICMAPQGRVFDDGFAQELSREDRLVFICGHYEGLDERIYALADDVISIGDYVLTSGELASMVVIDAVVRKIPGVLGAEKGADEESFTEGLLEFPQYTRPASYRGLDVPDVLLSGHHEKVDLWRREQSIARTLEARPDMILEALDSKILDNRDLDVLLSCLDDE